MTLQDDLAAAFVAGMRDVVHGLSQEDPVSHHLEEPVGQGWADVSVRTKSRKLLFEIKTNIRDTPQGEVHDAELGSSLRQLKKYADKHPEDIVSVIIPLNDARKLAAHYANEGIHVVTWYATRIVKCPRCRREYRISHEQFTAPNRCEAERCGYEGRFEQGGLQQPIFDVYGAVEVKAREPREQKKDGILEKLQYELNEFAKALGPNWDREHVPELPLTLWKSISTSGQLTAMDLSPPQFAAISGLYAHVEHYNEVLDSMIGVTVRSGEHIRAMDRLEKARQVLLEEIPMVGKHMGWVSQ